MAKSDQETPAREDTSQPTGKSSGMLPAAVLLLAMIIGSASAAVAIASVALRPSQASETQPEEDTAEAEAPSEESDEVQEFAFDEPIIVNVRETDQRRYLSAKPVFVVTNKEELTKLTDKQGELQNLLIGVLKSKTLPQLDDPQITGSLGREIQDIANAKLGMDGKITRVYFTQLVVQ